LFLLADHAGFLLALFLVVVTLSLLGGPAVVVIIIDTAIAAVVGAAIVIAIVVAACPGRASTADISVRIPWRGKITVNLLDREVAVLAWARD
jgi:hypothetical protein